MENLNSIISDSFGHTSFEIDIVALVINFSLCICMSFLVRAFYIKYSVSLTGKHHIGVVLPILAAIIFLVIMVVKSSLALSLGLVGALSVVRFRTPVKEPEELVYLFLVIAIGLGYGAGHTILTTSLSLSILAMIYYWLSNKNTGKVNEYTLVINWKKNQLMFSQISDCLISNLNHIKLVRLDQGQEVNTAVLLVIPDSNVTIDTLTDQIRLLDPESSISFYESRTNW